MVWVRGVREVANGELLSQWGRTRSTRRIPWYPSQSETSVEVKQTLD